MSFNEVLAELPALTVEERQMLVRRALELDESPLSPADEAEIERRQAAQRLDPASALSREEIQSRIRKRLVDIELATVSALRALQMDIDGDTGTSSATVLKRARAELR